MKNSDGNITGSVGLGLSQWKSARYNLVIIQVKRVLQSVINSVIERKLVTDHQWLFPWKNAFVISHSGKRVQHKTSYPVTLLLTDLLHLQGNSGPVLGWTMYTSYQSSAYTQTYCMQCLPVITSYSDDDDDFYIVFSALEQTHCIFVACDSKSDSQQKADPGEKKNPLPLLPRLEPVTFQSQAQCSTHGAIPVPWSNWQKFLLWSPTA